MLLAILQTFAFEIAHFMEAVSTRKYEQLVKSKKKEVKLELIKREDLLEVIKERVGIDLMLPEGATIVELLSHLLQLDAKYPEVYQLKSVLHLMQEVLARHIKEEQDRKVLEEFYQPNNAAGKHR
jgi:hypothetical protein